MTTTPTMIETIVPFYPGHYHSEIEDMIDQEIEMELEENDLTYEDIEDRLDFSAAFNAISRQWLNKFNQETGFNIQFKEIDSPREYNFTTDKLVGSIPIEEVEQAMIKASENPGVFQEVLDKHFTQRDGFIPFYSNDADEWDKNADELDCNEVMVYIETAILVDTEEYDLLDTIHGYSSVYEAAQSVWKY